MYSKNELFSAGKPILLTNKGLDLPAVTQLLKNALVETNISAGLNVEIEEDKAEIRTIFSSKVLDALVIRSLDDPAYPRYVLAYSWTGAFVDVNRCITGAKPKTLTGDEKTYFEKVDALVNVALTFE